MIWEVNGAFEQIKLESFVVQYDALWEADVSRMTRARRLTFSAGDPISAGKRKIKMSRIQTLENVNSPLRNGVYEREQICFDFGIIGEIRFYSLLTVVDSVVYFNKDNCYERS